MLNQTNTFKTVSHHLIKSNISVSSDGKVHDSRGIHNPSYLSSNGYLYEFIQTTDDKLILFPFDIIMALTFVRIPRHLLNKKIKVIHINGNTADCRSDNLEWAEDIEIWAWIDYDNIKPNYYQISNHGRIRSMLTDPPKIMKNELTKHGYFRISLMNIYGKHSRCSIHRLVGIAFIKGYKKNLQINHIDGVKLNNNWNNLEWITPSCNIKHAYMCHLAESASRKINDDDAILICLSLNNNNGSIIDVYNELNAVIKNLSYSLISSIKYETTFKHISCRYLSDSGRKKYTRQTDPDVIIDVSECLKRHNGDVKKTKIELQSKYPWITYGWIWHLKDKSVGSEITDQIFDKNEFPKGTPLTEKEAIMIIESLIRHKDEQYTSQLVFDELKDSIKNLTKDKVRAIKDKKSWKYLSDRYFKQNEI